MKDELGGKIMTEFVALRPKTYSYLTDDDINSKNSKGTKRCGTDKLMRYNYYAEVLYSNSSMLMPQLGFKKEGHKVYTIKINKIALSSNDDRRLQTLDNITSYSYGTSVEKV